MTDRSEIDIELKRIFLKFLILKIISERPTYGYEIIQEIKRQSDGRWAPGCGSIYPALNKLESNGWIIVDDIDRRKVYSITPDGRAALDRIIREWYGQASRIAHIFGELIGASSDSLHAPGASEPGANIK